MSTILSVFGQPPYCFLTPLSSPLQILSSFPPTLLVTTDVDPCLDECVEFSSRLHDAGARVRLEVLGGLPHGFLSLGGFSKDCKAAVGHLLEKIRDALIS